MMDGALCIHIVVFAGQLECGLRIAAAGDYVPVTVTTISGTRASDAVDYRAATTVQSWPAWSHDVASEEAPTAPDPPDRRVFGVSSRGVDGRA